ncbi:MAG TPA: Uma2 family endonuclease [Tepidisphaeraceae bacterium]|jgi:Uma2 family endonuclease
MTLTLPQGIADKPSMVYRLTVDDYHDMIASGLLREGAPYELLDGQVLLKIRNASEEDPMTVGTHHMTIVMRLADLSPRFQRWGCHIRSQGPVTLPPYDEPEPDAAIVRGSRGDYLERHPTAQDILCGIEVADASLPRDRGYKQQIYANSGIPQYVILNLPDRLAEVYTQPLAGKGRYAQSITLSPSQSLTLPTARKKSVTVPVRTLLP